MPANPMGGSDWMSQQGLTPAPKERIAGLLGEGIGGVLPGVIGAKAPQIAGGLLGKIEQWAANNATKHVARNIDAASVAADSASFTAASKGVKMSDPKPQAQRPFYDDYPQGIAGQNGSPITLDIDGRPINSGAYIAGRRVAGQNEQGLSAVETDQLGGLLGYRVGKFPRSGGELKGDAGRFVGLKIYVGGFSEKKSGCQNPGKADKS